MKPLPHRYEVQLSGGPAGYAELSAVGLSALRTAPPTDFGGPGDAWSPEHLLVAAVQACFLFTLRAVARASKVPFTNLELTACGTVDRSEGVTRFTDIVLRARVTVPPGTDHARVLQVLEQGKKACLVTASLSAPVRLEPDVDDA